MAIMSQTIENNDTTMMMMNRKRSYATMAFSSLPNSISSSPNPVQEKLCYVMRSPTLNLKLILSKPPTPPSQVDHQSPLTMMLQQPEPVPEPLPVPKKRRSPKKNYSSSEVPKKNKKLKKTTEKFVDEGNTIISSVVEHVKRNFGYNEVMDAKIIMEKKITASDVKDFQGRLAIPTSKDNLIAPFLTRDEEELVNSKDEITLKKMNMNVKVISGMSEYEMPLARWDYHHHLNKQDGGYKYVLKNGRSGAWTKLRKEQRLQEDDHILIATFRHNHALHFVIIKRNPVMLFGKLIGHNYSFN